MCIQLRVASCGYLDLTGWCSSSTVAPLALQRPTSTSECGEEWVREGADLTPTGSSKLVSNSGCSEERVHEDANMTSTVSARLVSKSGCGEEHARVGVNWPPQFTDLATSKEAQVDRRGCQSPGPRQRGRHPASSRVLQHENCEGVLHANPVRDGKARSQFSSDDDLESRCSTRLTSAPISPCMSGSPLHGECQSSGVEDSLCGLHGTDVVYTVAPRDHSPSPSTPAQDDKGLHLKVPRLPLSRLGDESQEGALRDRRGEHSPDPRLRLPMTLVCHELARTVPDTIEVHSLAGEVLCTLDGSAKLLTVRELKFLIKDRTGIFVDCQELLNGEERLPDWPVEDARPLVDVRGPLTLTLVRSEPLPTFRAPI